MKDFVTTRKCDGCGMQCSGVLIQGTSSGFNLFHCKVCDPQRYEEVANQEKERWLTLTDSQ